jgi:hypothetical protein
MVQYWDPCGVSTAYGAIISTSSGYQDCFWDTGKSKPDSLRGNWVPFHTKEPDVAAAASSHSDDLSYYE